MNDKEFRKQLAFGEEGEHLVARKLIQAGTKILPLYQFETKSRSAPVLLASFAGADGVRHGASTILPDLLCWGDSIYFAEVKRKNQWTLVREGNGLETGFSPRLLRDYLWIQTITGHEVWVFFIHHYSTIQRKEHGFTPGDEAPHGVYRQRLRMLDRRKRLWDGRDRDNVKVSAPVALFPHSCLEKVWDLDELEL